MEDRQIRIVGDLINDIIYHVLRAVDHDARYTPDWVGGRRKRQTEQRNDYKKNCRKAEKGWMLHGVPRCDAKNILPPNIIPFAAFLVKGENGDLYFFIFSQTRAAIQK